MTSSNSMTREELLESAALDAFALLDEYETALYTRSFHNAPAAVQDQIMQLQAQLVSDESLLPTENPDPLLRSRVLEAVATAIEHETAHLEPLAVIGHGRGAVMEPAMAGPLGLSGQFWRAAAFAMAAGLIVIAYFLTQLSSQHNQIAVIALTKSTDAQLDHLIGPTVKEYLFNPTAKSVHFTAASAVAQDPTPRAVLYVAEDSDKAFLVFEGLLQTAQPYTLSVKHTDGRMEPIKKFESGGTLAGIHVAINRATAQFKNVTWEISNPNGVIVLASL